MVICDALLKHVTNCRSGGFLVFPNHANAWREILERIFAGLAAQENVTPDWLVNPETGRHLKLDRYYPDAGIAFRFMGGTGKRKAPLSEQEIEEETHRDGIRERLCAAAGVSLIPIDLYESEPRKVLNDIRSALSRSARLLAQGEGPQKVKAERTERLARAKRTCDSLAMRVRSVNDLTVYAELWEDRQYAALPEPSAKESQKPGRHTYAMGMRVRHEQFGAGKVTNVRQEQTDTVITVEFRDSVVKSFMASLAQDKLVPIG